MLRHPSSGEQIARVLMRPNGTKTLRVPPAADYISLGLLSGGARAMKNAHESWPAGPRRKNFREITAPPLSSSQGTGPCGIQSTSAAQRSIYFVVCVPVQWMKFALTETNGRRAFSIVRERRVG